MRALIKINERGRYTVYGADLFISLNERMLLNKSVMLNRRSVNSLHIPLDIDNTVSSQFIKTLVLHSVFSYVND